MAFFDKLNDLAKNIGDKTGDAIEMGRINAKIASDKKEVLSLMQKIGEYYYENYKGGELPPEVIKDYFAAADEKNQLIEEAKAELEKLKILNEGGASTAYHKIREIPCPNCGEPTSDDAKFCGTCGSRLY